MHNYDFGSYGGPGYQSAPGDPDGGGPRQPGAGEGLRGARARADMRNAPAGQDVRQPHIRVVVHDHRRDPGQA